VYVCSSGSDDVSDDAHVEVDPNFFSLHNVILKRWNSFPIQPSLLVSLKQTIYVFGEFMSTSYSHQHQSVYVFMSIEGGNDML